MNRDEAREAAVNEAVEFFLGDEFNRVTVQEQFGKLFDAGYQAGSEGAERLRQALEDIVNPIGYLQREAEKDGARLNGMAYQIAKDPNMLQGIAKAALEGQK